MKDARENDRVPLLPDTRSNKSCLERVRSRPSTVLAIASIALFVDQFCYGLIIPVIPIYVQQRFGATVVETGLLFSSLALASLVATPIFGVLCDKFGRKYPLILGLLGLGGSAAFFALATSFYQLVIARVLQGISGAATWVGALAILADTYPQQELGTAMGTVMAINSVGFLLGPVIGGFAYEYSGYKIWAPFAVCGGLVLVDLILRLVLMDDRAVKNFSASTTAALPSTGVNTSGVTAANASMNDSSFAQTAPTFLSLMCDPVVMLNSFVCVVTAMVFASLEPTLPLFFQTRLHATPSGISLLFLGIVISNMLGSIVSGYVSDRIGRNVTIAGGVLGLALTLPCLALPRSLGPMVGALIGVGVPAGFALTPLMPQLAERVDILGGGAYAQVYAIFNLAYSAGTLAGPAAGTALMQYFGIQIELCAMSTLLVVMLPIFIGCSIRCRNRATDIHHSL